MSYTKGEIKTLGDAWRVLEEHGLEGTYCSEHDQFAQARVLQKQDELISDMYEALKEALQDLAELDRIQPSTERIMVDAKNKAEGK